MIVKRLLLKNFKSYGTVNGNPIEIDLTDYDKLAIVGNNGAGKSTLIDAITFALFGKAVATEIKEVGSKELINDKANEAYAKVVFEKDGVEYEAERSLRRASGGMARLIIDGVPSAQTGSRAVTEAINRILGMDYDTFISSTIIRQDEMDNLTSKTPAKRKESLMNIFGLNVYERFAEKAKEKMRDTETNMKVNEATVKEKTVFIQKEPEIKNRVKSLRREERRFSRIQFGLNKKIDGITKKRDEYYQKKVEFERVEANYEGKVRELKREKAILSETENEVIKSRNAERKLKKLLPKYREYKSKDRELESLRKVKEKYDKAVKDRDVAKKAIDAEKKGIKSNIISIGKELRKLASEKKSKIKELKELIRFAKVSDIKIVNNNKQIEKLAKQKEDKVKLFTTIEQQIKQTNSQLREMKDNKNKIERQKTNVCPVCKQSLKKMTRAQLLRHYTSEISKCTKELNKLKSWKTKLGSEIINLNNNLQKKENYRKKLHRLRTKIGRMTELQKRIKAIEKDIEEKSESRKALQRRLDKSEYSMSDREKLSRAVKTIKELDFDVFLFRRLSNYISRNKGIEEEKATLETQAQRLPLLLTKLEGQRTKITNLDAECCGLKTEVSKLRPFAEKYDKFEKQRSELEEGRRTIIKNITTCKTQIQESLNQLDEIQRTKSEVKVLEKKIKQQALEIRAYKKLSEEIFGKDGIPTEILREKVPEIESESSEILSQISNGKFFTSINFSRKEEIVVQAVDINGEHPVFRFSAGEKMKINMALRLGISEVIAKRKGSKGKLETLIIDEGFGQLDTEGRKAVIGVINSLMERFKKIIVISHLEDIKDTFDTKLLVENIGGYSKVRIVS